MEISETELPGVVVLEPKRHGDHRGFFSETFNVESVVKLGISPNWVQDNHSFSSRKGVIRGLHFQAPPYAQDKIIRVTRGAILDVAVDIRRGSRTYGKWTAVELSEENWRQLLVPAGFAHGFCTLSDAVEVLYKVTARYAPEAEGGLRWDDASLAIPWPVTPDEAIVSDRDRKWGPFEVFTSPF